jgi:hypothetical protein
MICRFQQVASQSEEILDDAVKGKESLRLTSRFVCKASIGRADRLDASCEGERPTPFKGRHFEPEIIILCVRRYLRYALSLRNLEEIMVERNGQLIAKVAAFLPSGGRLLFTAPSEACCWFDAMTGQTSISLGLDEYRNAIEARGTSLIGTQRDEGENHYYFAQKK